MTTTPPVAVTFDFWDTLVHAPGAATMSRNRGARVLGVLGGLGIDLGEERLVAIMAEARRVFDEAWQDNRQFQAADAVDVLIGHLEGEDRRSAEAHREELVQAVASPTGDEVPSLTPHVADTLRTLDEAGVRLGIICDVGLVPSPTLRGYLSHHGVLDRFDHWSFSDEVGVYKPDPAIFHHALRGLGVDDPARAVHVGDLRRTDVAGARRLGILSVRYTGSNDDVAVPAEGDRAMLGSSSVIPDDVIEADHVIDDHARLPALLGLA